jgi:hypothetical protein
MHRPLFIVAFVLLLVCVPLSAQHGGGHASGGGHGFSGGHGSFGGGHMSGGHAFSGGHSGSSFAGHPSASARGFASRPSISSRGVNRGVNRSGGVRLRNGLRNRGYLYGGYGYPWLYGGYYDPYWWWDSDSRFDYDQQYETGLANEMNEQSLEEQRLRAQSDQYVYARPAPLPPRQARPTEALPATVLIFRDQHKQEVMNYAIVGQTLWNFAPEHTQKIPLSDLDLPATTKANDDRGVSFRLPGAGEGQ